MIVKASPNGEITYNSDTGLFYVWDETYAYTVIETPSLEEAKRSLKEYGEQLDQMFERDKAFLKEHGEYFETENEEQQRLF